MDLATRVYNHNWKIDPIVRSLLDTDFYELLMLQLVWQYYGDVYAEFELINRNPEVPLAKIINYEELQNQLNYAQTLKLTRSELTFLRGNTFYGKRRIFKKGFLEWFEKYHLPKYELGTSHNGDQFSLKFKGKLMDVMLWEIHSLQIISELKNRAALSKMSKYQLQVLYARATTALWHDLESLSEPNYQPNIVDFGTRRRHSWLWQSWAIQMAQEILGENFRGTSNCYHAMENDLEAIGTNSHVLPMMMAGLAKSDKELAKAPYAIMKDWKSLYDGNLLIALTDTFGSDEFYKKAPEWVKKWKGIRIDSGDPFKEAKKAMDWWCEIGQDPIDKILIFSDGLNATLIRDLYAEFNKITNLSFGWGSLFTNNFTFEDELRPISLVCKITSVGKSLDEMKPTVKISNNPLKAIGKQTDIERYKKVFNTGGQDAIKPVV